MEGGEGCFGALKFLEVLNGRVLQRRFFTRPKDVIATYRTLLSHHWEVARRLNSRFTYIVVVHT